MVALSVNNEIQTALVYLGIAAFLGGLFLRGAFALHGKIWRRTGDNHCPPTPSFGGAIVIFAFCIAGQMGAMMALALMLLATGILNTSGHGSDRAPIGLYLFLIPIEYLVAAGIIWLASTPLTFARALVIAVYQLLFVIAACFAFRLIMG